MRARLEKRGGPIEPGQLGGARLSRSEMRSGQGFEISMASISRVRVSIVSQEIGVENRNPGFQRWGRTGKREKRGI